MEALKPRESGLVPAQRKYPNELRERAMRRVSEAREQDLELSLDAAASQCAEVIAPCHQPGGPGVWPLTSAELSRPSKCH